MVAKSNVLILLAYRNGSSVDAFLVEEKPMKRRWSGKYIEYCHMEEHFMIRIESIRCYA